MGVLPSLPRAGEVGEVSVPIYGLSKDGWTWRAIIYVFVMVFRRSVDSGGVMCGCEVQNKTPMSVVAIATAILIVIMIGNGIGERGRFRR